MLKTGNGPGRPREFKIDDAIASALDVFQERGYASTSLPDLIEGTGLSRGSLYKAFPDKHTLYVAALDRYIQSGVERLASQLREKSPAEAIRQVLLHYARLSSGNPGLKGCMVVSAATEMLPHDELVAERVRWMFERMKALLGDAIARGQAEGAIPADRDPESLSSFLLCVIEGMRVLGKAGGQERRMKDIAAVASGVLL
ncbi:MAG TPA: TetR/AcrR family transcriptional regulator [Candidatus Sulfotelmatobacter sp.]|nr:TetR/AcrR family transcriptional regulator [Candidatus Sulfotelmatobacter sp.]